MYSYNQFSRVWFLTWTCYGQWLPGDSRGFVSNKFEGDVTEKRNNIVRTPYDQGRPELWKMARRNLVGEPVTLTAEQAEEVWEQFTETAAIRHWTLITCAIMYNHVHLMVGVPGDPNPEDILRDLKKWASIRLNRKFPTPPSGKWWTQSGSKRKIDSEKSFNRCFEYIQHQPQPLLLR